MNSTRSLLRPAYRVQVKEHVVERWTVPAATFKLCAPDEVLAAHQGVSYRATQMTVLELIEVAEGRGRPAGCCTAATIGPPSPDYRQDQVPPFQPTPAQEARRLSVARLSVTPSSH